MSHKESEVVLVLTELKKATCPEDVFGAFVGSADEVEEKMRRIYLRMAKILHPDKHSDSDNGLRALAEEGFKLLSNLWSQAQLKIEQGLYGVKTAVPESKISGNGKLGHFESRKYVYVLTKRLHSGGTCGVFAGGAESKINSETFPVVMRVPHNASDNDLMSREARAFLAFQGKVSKLENDSKEAMDFGAKLLDRLPNFLESLRLNEPGGGSTKRVVNIFRQLPGSEQGWYSLEEIREKHSQGIGSRAMAFIWNRVLEGLTLPHASGIVHGALTPNHVVVQTDTHAANIVDWTASCQRDLGDKVPYLDDRYQSYFPPELLHNGIPFPATDIYMSAWCMVYLLGGDPMTGDVPGNVEEPIARLLNRCLQPKISQRPQKVDRLYHEFREITKKLWGPRKFVQLLMT